MARIPTLLALMMVLVSGAAVAQETQSGFRLETYTEGQGGYFTFANETARNPDLHVAPGATVTVTLVGTDDGVHNIQVADQEPSDYVESANETVVYTFTAPASGTIGYWCVPHRYTGMAGNVVVVGGEEDENGAPGVPLGLLAAGLLFAAIALRRGRSDH